jgi:E1A-binding protein p400
MSSWEANEVTYTILSSTTSRDCDLDIFFYNKGHQANNLESILKIFRKPYRRRE